MTAAEENRAVAALLALAERTGSEERADVPSESRAPGQHDDAEGLALAERHGIDATRIAAYRGLASSRGITLEQCLRALFRGELADVVRLEQVPQ
jgi:hypothetical protein